MVQRGYPPPPSSPPPLPPETLNNMLLRAANQIQPGAPPNVSPLLGNMQQFGVNAAQGNPPLPSEPPTLGLGMRVLPTLGRRKQ